MKEKPSNYHKVVHSPDHNPAKDLESLDFVLFLKDVISHTGRPIMGTHFGSFATMHAIFLERARFCRKSQ